VSGSQAACLEHVCYLLMFLYFPDSSNSQGRSRYQTSDFPELPTHGAGAQTPR